MRFHLRSALTLLVLAALLLVGGAWGWSALREPFPQQKDSSGCVTAQIDKGGRLSAAQVTVSVYNASGRDGLAQQTMSALAEQGFTEGAIGNAPEGVVVPFAQVWSKSPKDPAVRLVLSRLGPQAHVAPKKLKAPGVVVVVGNLFQKPVKGLPSVKVHRITEVCTSP
jgi:hypothetical protein